MPTYTVKVDAKAVCHETWTVISDVPLTHAELLEAIESDDYNDSRAGFDGQEVDGECDRVITHVTERP